MHGIKMKEEMPNWENMKISEKTAGVVTDVQKLLDIDKIVGNRH